MIQKAEPVPDPLTLSRRGGYTMVIPLNECFIVQRSLQDKKAQLCENRLHLGSAVLSSDGSLQHIVGNQLLHGNALDGKAVRIALALG